MSNLSIPKKIYTELKIMIKKTYLKVFRINEFVYSYLNFKINLNISKDVDKRLYLYGFEVEIIELFISIIKKDDVIFDIGSNIGLYSLIASDRIGENGKIYAFEPAPIAFKSLQKNIELNSFKNIKSISKGVSEKSGEAILNMCDDDAYNSLGNTPMKEISSKEKIEIVSIDDFVKYNNISKVDIIKIDTEGAEYLILKGGEKTLLTHRPKLFFEHNPFTSIGFENTLEDTLIFLKSLGYKLFEFNNKSLIEIIDLNNIKGYDIFADFNEEATF